MREVSDDFLLNMAEVSAALIGLFMVGVFFFADTGFAGWTRPAGSSSPTSGPAPGSSWCCMPSRSASR